MYYVYRIVERGVGGNKSVARSIVNIADVCRDTTSVKSRHDNDPLWRLFMIATNNSSSQINGLSQKFHLSSSLCLNIKVISGDWPLLECVYFNKYLIPTKAE